MNRINWKALAKGFSLATVFVLAMGVLSYFTADGTAAIGPIPTSITAQRDGIATNTLQWAIAMGLGALVAFVLSRKAPHISPVQK